MLPAAQTLPAHDPAYIPALQCLRGIAALAVVIAHIAYAQKQLFPDYPVFLPEINSFWGVDLFFVISGFVIAYITTNTAAGAANAQRFLLFRLIRIVPAYWFYTLIVLAATIYIGGEQISFAFFWKSMFFIKPGFPLLLVGWTLTYEVFFYVLYTVVLLFLNHKHRVLAVSCILILLVAVRAFGNMTNVYVKFYSNPILLEFIAGMLIGSLPMAFTPKRWLPLLSLIAGGGTLCIVSTILELETLIKFRAILWGLPAAFIVWGAVNILRTRRSTLLEKLGNISYSIYLIHVPITTATALALHRLIDPSLNPVGLHVVLSFTATIVLASVSYTLIEQTSSRWLKKILRVRHT